jgi:hypothetical protein
MPTHGHDLGIDTADQLRLLGTAHHRTGPDVRGWRPGVPVVLAGRYFLQTPGGAHLWVDGETAGVKNAQGGQAALNPDLTVIGAMLTMQTPE